VTRERPHLLRRAIDCFRMQDYGPRELLVVVESDDSASRRVLDELRDPAIRRLEVAAVPKLSLGALRNAGIAACRGHYLAQWDDDDWYAPNRLGAQIAAIRKHRRPACVLARWILYDESRGQAYLSATRTWEGSIVVERAALPTYADRPRGEDTPVLEKLVAAGRVILLDEPWLYVYVFHGKNTWGREHFERNLLAYAARLAPHEEAQVRARLERFPSAQQT
jgi:glycosyltransferase involved in cell wall biosynthesis